MKMWLFTAFALVATALAACSNCTPGPFDEPVHCTPAGDGTAAECTSTQTCAPIVGAKAPYDNRCFDSCADRRCGAGYSCAAVPIGSDCGRPPSCGADGNDLDCDGGVSNCHTAFLCMPTFCG